MARQRAKMARCRRSDDDYSDGSDYSGDVPASDEDEVFDVEAVKAEDADSETSVMRIDGFGDNCNDIDMEGQVQLFEGNIHSREYYLQGLEEFNDAAFDGEDYSEGSTILLDGIEELWNRYVVHRMSPQPQGLIRTDKSQVLRLSRA